jgi:hypothetical protein
MSWSPFIIIELVMVLGGALLWGWWELRTIKKDNEKVAKARAAQEKPLANSSNRNAADE